MKAKIKRWILKKVVNLKIKRALSDLGQRPHTDYLK